MADRVGIRMFALAVAMRAKSGTLEVADADVAGLVTRVQQQLPGDDPLARACTGFAVQHEMHARDRDKMADLGDALAEAVRIDTLPDAPDAERRDIHG